MVDPIDKVYTELTSDLQSFKIKEETKEAQTHKQGVTSTISALKEISQTSSIELILKAEEAVLTHTLTNYSNSPEMTSSLETALEDMAPAFSSLDLVQDTKEYSRLAETYSRKDKQAGLPLDGFRKFERSHQTRLQNSLKNQISPLDKKLIRQRKENLKRAKSLYTDLQRKSLGLRIADKSNDLGY